MGYGVNYEKPRNLNEDEWVLVSVALESAPHLRRAITILKEHDSAPTAARHLLPQEYINQGNEYHNNYFRKAGTPFRLTRVGSWGLAGTCTNRYDRKLALVPWDNARGRPVAPTSASIPRLSID